jgi:hypothetical protein
MSKLGKFFDRLFTWGKADKRTPNETGANQVQGNSLDAYLSSVPCGYAVLLSGPWGVGKSFFWRRYQAKVISEFDLTPITVSAAGLQNSEELERVLFQASIANYATPALREFTGVIGRAMLRVVKVDPADIKLKAETTGGRTVVCIDDVERFAGDPKTLFGFAINLLDESGLHVILIADETKVDEVFNEYKERIVGKTVRVEPDLGKFCDEIICGFSDRRTRDFLLQESSVLVDYLREKGVSNLRTVRAILIELELILRNVRQSSALLNLSGLLGAITFYTIAVGRSAANIKLVEKAFSTAELGVALAMYERKGGEDDDSVLGQLLNLLEELKFVDDSYGFPESKAFINLVGGRAVDYQQLANDFALISPPSNNTTADPLAMLQHYRDLDDVQLREQIERLSSELFDGAPADLARVFESYRILYWLSKNSLLSDSPDVLTEKAVDLVSKLEPSTLTATDLEFWTGPYDGNEQKVISALQGVERKSAECRQLLARHEQRDSILLGSGPLPEAVHAPFFVDSDPEEVFSILNSQKNIGIARLQSIFRKRLRIVNSPDFVGEDRNFAIELSSLIEQRVDKTSPVPIKSALLIELAEILKNFAKHVDDYRSKGR